MDILIHSNSYFSAMADRLNSLVKVADIRNYIFIAVYFLCATVLSTFTNDQSLAIRFTIIAFGALSLFLLYDLEIPCIPLVTAFMGYLFFAIISLLWANNAVQGLNEVSKIFLLLILFKEACMILRTDREFFIKGMTVLAVILGLYCLCERILFTKSLCNGTMYVRNVWSSAQLLLLPFCVSSIKRWRYAGIFASSLIVVNLILLLNRASIIALFIMAGIFVYYYRKTLRYYIIAGIIIVLLACLINPSFFNTSSLRARFAVWTATAKLVSENPYFGIGINNWPTEIPRYSSDFLEEYAFSKIIYTRPHNDYLWVLAEVGIFGFICYMGIILSGIYCAVRSGNIRALAFLAGYMVIAFFSFPKERAFHSILLIAGLADAVTGHGYKTIKIPGLARDFVLVSLCLVTVQFTTCYISERHIRKMGIARESKKWDVVLAESEKISWLRPIDVTTLPITWYTGEAHYHLGNRQKAAMDISDSLKCNPNNVFVLDRAGEMFAGLGNLEAAEACYRRALQIQPKFKMSEDKLNKILETAKCQ